MRQISIHDDDKVSCRTLDTVNVGRAEAELLLPMSQNDFVWAVDILKSFGDL